MEDMPETKSCPVHCSRHLARRVLLILTWILFLLLVTQSRFVVSTIKFFHRMDQLPPWPNVITEDIVGTSFLDEEKRIACFLLEQTEQDRRRMITVYQTYIKVLSWRSNPRPEISAASKLYLLLRLLFDVPEEYPQEEARFYGGWMISRAREDGSWTIDAPPAREGTANLLWPLGYEQGRLVLKGTILAQRGSPYDGLWEYDSFDTRFPLRSVDELK